MIVCAAVSLSAFSGGRHVMVDSPVAVLAPALGVAGRIGCLQAPGHGDDPVRELLDLG
jgi:hypothetical protein